MAYMESYLRGEIELRDRVEKKHDWTLLTRLFVSTWLLKFDRENKLARAEAEKWAAVVTAGFKGHAFDYDAYLKAYKRLLQPETGKSIWGIQNFYVVSLLSNELTRPVQEKFLNYIMSDEEGIYYIYDGCLQTCPSAQNAKQTLRFINAHELLSVYEEYPKHAGYMQTWLNEMKTETAVWDLGAKAKDGVQLPLSESWRKKRNREIDCTVIVLCLLKCFE